MHNLMMGKSRVASVIPVLFLVGKCYPGDVPDRFFESYVFEHPIFWKIRFHGRCPKSQCQYDVLELGCVRWWYPAADFRFAQQRAWQPFNLRSRKSPRWNAPKQNYSEQGSQACISKLWLRVIHGSWCTVHDGLCIMPVTRRVLHDTSRTMNVASVRMHATRCISHTAWCILW